jgi:hypothetical protein
VQRQVSTLEYNTTSQAQSQSLSRFVVIVPRVLLALLPLTLAAAASGVLLDRGNGDMRGSTTLLTARAPIRAVHRGCLLRRRQVRDAVAGAKSRPREKPRVICACPTLPLHGREGVFSLLAGAMFQGSEGDQTSTSFLHVITEYPLQLPVPSPLRPSPSPPPGKRGGVEEREP